MKNRALLLMGLVALLTTPANALLNSGIGPQLGFYKAHDADNWSLMGGVAYRLKIIPLLGAEASINYRQETYADKLVTVRSWPVMVTGLIYPIPVVYGAIGLGWYNVTYDFDQDKLPLFDDKTRQKIGWHFGGGAELPMGPKMRVTGDIRYVFLDYDFQEIPGSGDQKNDFVIITVGLLFGL